jgi:RimJ/RimL family protein N-acetyltransferase
MTGDGALVYPDGPAGPFEAPPRSFEDGEGREVRLAAAGGDDLEAIVEMYADFDPADRAQGIPPAGEERIREWVDDLVDQGHNVVAREDERVVGHGTLVPDDDGGYELAIFVLGEYQGAGVGTELIRALLGHGANEGIEKVWLTVEPWNHAAIHVYEKVGFEPCGSGSFERRFSIRL